LALFVMQMNYNIKTTSISKFDIPTGEHSFATVYSITANGKTEYLLQIGVDSSAGPIKHEVYDNANKWLNEHFAEYDTYVDVYESSTGVRAKWDENTSMGGKPSDKDHDLHLIFSGSNPAALAHEFLGIYGLPAGNCSSGTCSISNRQFNEWGSGCPVVEPDDFNCHVGGYLK